MTTKLVPCPLCGADKGYTLLIGMHYRWRTIACFSCGAEIGETHTTYPVDHESLAQSADEAWNSAGKHAQGLRDEIARLNTENVTLRAAIEYTLPLAEEEWYHEHLVAAGVNSFGSRAVEMMRNALAKEPK